MAFRLLGSVASSCFCPANHLSCGIVSPRAEALPDLTPPVPCIVSSPVQSCPPNLYRVSEWLFCVLIWAYVFCISCGAHSSPYSLPSSSLLPFAPIPSSGDNSLHAGAHHCPASRTRSFANSSSALLFLGCPTQCAYSPPPNQNIGPFPTKTAGGDTAHPLALVTQLFSQHFSHT